MINLFPIKLAFTNDINIYHDLTEKYSNFSQFENWKVINQAKGGLLLILPALSG
ncbi:hypothetical protein SpAn4DRAFT_4155 [Sporomusa ovata]|uniref:Uncharacterized protein n=1 Tax=Sporomusa ovata TaxID=2378 RepID=A0A0U1L522_9FIRM|nr:hypothetical protein SpAn4DRAFT_4155 [Sporomusa ovata]